MFVSVFFCGENERFWLLSMLLSNDNDDDDGLFLDIVRKTDPCPVSSDPSVSTSKEHCRFLS